MLKACITMKEYGMKRKNATKSAVLALSLLTLAGITPALSAGGTSSIAVMSDTQDAKAIEIIETSFEKVGGRELIENAKYVKQTGTLSVPMAGLTGTIQSYVKSPDKFLLVLTLPGMGEQRQGYSDGVAWSSDAMNGPRLLPEEETKAIKDEANIASRLNYKTEYPTIEYKGEIDFDGSKAHKIRLLDEDGEETIEFYGVESGLLIGSEATVPSPMGPTKTMTYIRGYQDMAGFLQPTKITQQVGPTKIEFEIKTVSYDEIDDSVFELPAAVKALIEATKKDD